jgi:DNA-binding NarL/FixJ family response regulator
MRKTNRLELATLYEGRAAQARQRAALLTSFLTTIELSYASIEAYRAQLPQRADSGPCRLHPVDGTDGSEHRPAPVPLTSRERQVAMLMACGYTNRQIADHLVITPGTVANHVSHILTKLGCRNRTEVALTISGSTEDGAHQFNHVAEST